jgi:Cu-processing system ATP-binding protein
MNTSANANLVCLNDVDKDYPRLSVLKAINIEIMEGEVVGLFGHNGAGKSTLMKLILGLIKPSRGEVTTLGHNPCSRHFDVCRHEIGYLPENVSFYEQLSGREVLYYFARLKGFSCQSADKLLDEVGLSESANRPVKQYSKGMKQRLGLAQAILGNPKLLILDEPTVGLDPKATDDFYHMVEKLKQLGTAVIMCTHILPGVERYLDRALILDHGQIKALGSLETLRHQSHLHSRLIVEGLTQSELETTFTEHALSINASLESDTRLFIEVDDTKKMMLLRHFSTHPKVSNLSCHEPSLQDMYRYFTQPSEARHSQASMNEAAP